MRGKTADHDKIFKNICDHFLAANIKKKSSVYMVLFFFIWNKIVKNLNVPSTLYYIGPERFLTFFRPKNLDRTGLKYNEKINFEWVSEWVKVE